MSGIDVNIDVLETKAHIKLHLHVLGCTCDLPAKAMVQNFMQFNGRCGCGFCEQHGCMVRTAGGGHVHTYPYIKESPVGPMRAKDRCMEYAMQAVKEQATVCHAWCNL